MSKRIKWANHVWRSNGILNKALEEKFNGKKPRQYQANRVNHDLRKFSQGVTIADSMDRWRKVVEAE